MRVSPPWRSPRASLTLLGWYLLLWPAVGAAAPAIILESHSGERPRDTPYTLEFLTRTLDPSSARSGAPLREAIEKRLSRPAGPMEAPAGIRGQVEEGRRQFIEGEFTRAIAQLEEARALLMQHSAVLAANQNLRDLSYKALLYLAHAYLRTRQQDQAARTVKEAIRSFPDREISLARYGPELARLYREARRTLGVEGLGSLTIETQPGECLVFLNERYVGLSPVRLEGLFPGDYRVYLQRPGAQGRVHGARVSPRGHHRLSFSFLLDRTLRSSAFAGLHFADRQEKATHEIPLALKVAAALDADQIMLFEFDRLRGRRVLRGRLIQAPSGSVARSALVFLDPRPPAPAALKSLGRLLVEGRVDPAEGFLVLRRAPAPDGLAAGQPQQASPGFFSARMQRWITLGAAVVSLGAGATLLAMHGQGTCDSAEGVRCEHNYSTMAPGIVLTSVGALSACASALFFYYASQPVAPERAALLLPWSTAGGGGLLGIVSF